MADVYTVVYTLVGILLSLPALLVALNLLLPNLTGRVHIRLSQTPGRSFFLGIPITAAFLLWIAITLNVNNGVVKGMGFIGALVGMGLGTLGAAGMSRLLGERLQRISGPTSELSGLVRGALVYEFACLFPIVGWFLFVPLVGIMVMGAAVFALLGWLPRPAIANQATAVSQQQASG
ncbi:MAG: hypothetical protein D6706_07840 [Chloroflexi bacterium]|nr:MAG: hypothetical protein D6706_07840 [Chloroflexota bacterium]